MYRSNKILGVAALLMMAACGDRGAPPAAPRTVLVQTVGQGVPLGSASFTGEVKARHEVDLAFRVGGKIAARLVDAGAEVKAGTPLARLDPADLELAQRAARAQLAAAESDAATAKADRDRYADLLARKFVSQAAFDARENAARAAQARLEQARAQSAASGNQVAYGTLTADQAGIITQIFADAGQVVAAGQPVMRLARPEEKEVAIAVPEGRVAELRQAKSLTVRFWAAPDVRLKGELRELSPAADPATRTFAARVRIVQPPADLRLGMTARVDLGAVSEGAPIVVPLSAVVDEGQGPAVWVVADGKARRQPVVVRQFREEGAVLASGLKGGEQIVVAGASRLAPDQPVKPVAAPESPR